MSAAPDAAKQFLAKAGRMFYLCSVPLDEIPSAGLRRIRSACRLPAQAPPQPSSSQGPRRPSPMRRAAIRSCGLHPVVAFSRIQAMKLANRGVRVLPSLVGKSLPPGVARSGGWGVARCYDARRLARTSPRTCGPSALLSAPHPSPSAIPSPSRAWTRGSRRRGRFALDALSATGSGQRVHSSLAACATSAYVAT
jgi:hypothetical protein